MREPPGLNGSQNLLEEFFVGAHLDIHVGGEVAGVPHPQRFAGLHFFNPAPLMKVIELMRAL
ncbi:3-hydroxyacyl-CoA dehydrogenase NAD-binding domain-containing protein [Streptomyces malaysiensis]|uniref:3-hydroxyacyl-CoA dehydrogenase NAD-binding domain-containing protein n=1 Tax=Streptomyces malaysiensis TaxID=92644 RepID=UPI002B30C6F5|nr:3-hydroxyacyl-CoA dehydrogenase NAD-binding domain-containing protein [Streptomyces malaysiensis]